MTLKFLRSVAVEAIHREQGSIHEIKDSDAAILLAEGAAIRCTAPETASLSPAQETASLAPSKPKKPRS